MGKNIVVIAGSPRKNGNNFAITEAFVKAAQAKGHTVTRFDAAFKKSAVVILVHFVSKQARHVRLTTISTRLFPLSKRLT